MNSGSKFRKNSHILQIQRNRQSVFMGSLEKISKSRSLGRLLNFIGLSIEEKQEEVDEDD